MVNEIFIVTGTATTSVLSHKEVAATNVAETAFRLPEPKIFHNRSVPKHGTASSSRKPQKRSRSIDLFDMEAVVMLRDREMAANKAHIAPHSQKAEALGAVADALNCNIDFVLAVNSKSISDCYERPKKTFDSKDTRDAMKSRVGVNVTEELELISNMRKARQKKGSGKNRAREAFRIIEKRRIETG